MSKMTDTDSSSRWTFFGDETCRLTSEWNQSNCNNFQCTFIGYLFHCY